MSEKRQVYRIVRKIGNFVELESMNGTKVLVNINKILGVVPVDRRSSTVLLEGWTVNVRDSLHLIEKVLSTDQEVQEITVYIDEI